MKNKNVPIEDKALEIPLVLSDLENKLSILVDVIYTLEERLKSVSRPYKDEPDPEATAATPQYFTTLGIRIDKSVTSASNSVDRIKTIIDFLEV